MIVEPIDADTGTRRDRDRALVEAHCTGDPHAFGTIVSDHYRVLLAQAERRLGNRTDAEDAVQETFERAFRAVCRFGQTGEFRLGAWLSRILSNVCNDHGGRAAAERGLTGRVELREVETGDAFEHVSDPVVLRAVHDAIDALPSSQRDTFLLKELDGLSYPQVADRLEITEDNARARVHRAKETLKRSLALTRAALGGFIAIPVGLRSVLRRGRDLSPAVPAGTGAEAGAAQSFAVQIAASPVGQAVAAIVPSGAVRGSAIAALAGLAVTGALAVPAVTGGSAKPTPDRQALSAPVSSVPQIEALVDAHANLQTLLPLTEEPAPASATSPSATTSTTSPPPADGAWWDAGAVFFKEPNPIASGSPCAVSAEELGVQHAGSARVVSKVDLPDTTLTPTETDAASSFALSAQFLDDALGGDPLHIVGRLCLAGSDGNSLSLDLTRGDESAHLAAPMVTAVAGDSSTTYMFRGGASGAPPSWGLQPEFLAKLKVHTDPDSGEKRAQLSIAFYVFDSEPQGEVRHIIALPAPPESEAPVPDAPASEPPADGVTDTTEPMSLPATSTTTLPPAAGAEDAAA